MTKTADTAPTVAQTAPPPKAPDVAPTVAPKVDDVQTAELFKPIDHGADDQPDLPAEVEGEAPPAPIGAPLAETFALIVQIAVNHLTPNKPLTPQEHDQLKLALERLEQYYGPVAGGPVLLWGHFAVIAFWIGFPRYMEIRRDRAAAAAAAAEAARGPGL